MAGDLLTRGKVRAGLEAVILRGLMGKPDHEPITEAELDAIEDAIRREMDAAYCEITALDLEYDQDDEDDMARKSAMEDR